MCMQFTLLYASPTHFPFLFLLPPPPSQPASPCLHPFLWVSHYFLFLFFCPVSAGCLTIGSALLQLMQRHTKLEASLLQVGLQSSAIHLSHTHSNRRSFTFSPSPDNNKDKILETYQNTSLYKLNYTSLC